MERINTCQMDTCCPALDSYRHQRKQYIRVSLAGGNDRIRSYLPDHLASPSVCLPQGKPAGASTADTATAPHYQRSKVSSTAAPCKPKQRKKTEASLSYGTAALNKTQSVGKERTVAPGGLFRKARGICRTFDQRARTPSSAATATRARKVTVPQRTTTTTSSSSSSTVQKSRPGDQGPSSVQADCGGATATPHEGACTHGSCVHNVTSRLTRPLHSTPQWEQTGVGQCTAIYIPLAM